MLTETGLWVLLLKSRLPSMYISRDSTVHVLAGLMHYSADPADSYRPVAYYVDRILRE